MGQCIICGEKTLAKGYCPKHYQKKFRHDRYMRYKDKEIESTRRRHQEKRQELLQRLGFVGKCQKCISEIDVSRARSLFVVDNKVICSQCWRERKKLNGFSRKFSECVKCGSTNEKHGGKGLCAKCYSDNRHSKEKTDILNGISK